MEYLRAKRSLPFGAVLILMLFVSVRPANAATDRSADPPKLAPLSLPTVPVGDNSFLREVFSLNELRSGNKYLVERIIETRMDFPLMFDPNSRFSYSLFQNPSRTRFGKNFSIIFSLRPGLWPEDGLAALEGLKRELVAQGVDRGRTDGEIRLDLLVFLKNRDILLGYVNAYPDMSEESRQELGSALQEALQVCASVLEFKTLTLGGIKSLDQIDSPSSDADGEDSVTRFDEFVEESKGMRAKDIAAVLEIRNQTQFSKLALERTAELLADADDEDVEQLLRDIGPSDAIVLASYFARDRIKVYRKPIDQMRDIYEGEYEDEALSAGDCRYFAGLAIHYLNMIVKPGNPKLRQWYFGLAREDISDYHHAYVLATHVYKNGDREIIDLFFFDPLALSSHSVGKLDKEDISRLIDAAGKNDHFFHIRRYGEDFVAQKYKSNDQLEDVPPVGKQADRTLFDEILGDP